MVLNGVGFKAFMSDNTRLNRTRLRIHPDQGQQGSAGCIGIDASAVQLRLYRSYMERYFDNNPTGNISLLIDVPGNPNYNNTGTSTFRGGE
jgi:hypothetical protein